MTEPLGLLIAKPSRRGPDANGAAVSALILAGGKATRLGGFPKHQLVVGGRSIFERQCDVLGPRVAEILVSGATIRGYRTVRDVHIGAGPLAGIAAGLAAARTPWVLVVAGDMPHVSDEVVDRMLAARAQTIDVVGVRRGGRPEPLLCILHARVHDVVARRLAAGQWKASGLLTEEGLAVSWLDDIDARLLTNLNSPEDLPGAERDEGFDHPTLSDARLAR